MTRLFSLRLAALGAAALLTVSTALVGCDSGGDSDGFDISDYRGTYRGTATASIPGQTAPPASPFTATVTTGSGSSVTLAFVATSPDGNVPITLKGTYSGSGAVFTSLVEAPTAATNVRVSESGSISGTIFVPDFFGQSLTLTAAGTVTKSNLTMTLTSATPSGTFTVSGTK